MNELVEISKVFADFTPGAYGIWTGVLMFMGWWIREWRETRASSRRLIVLRAATDTPSRCKASWLKTARCALISASSKPHTTSIAADCQVETDGLRRELRLTREELEEMKSALLMAGNVHKEGHIKMMVAGGKG